MHGITENDVGVTTLSDGLDIPANVDTEILSTFVNEGDFRRIGGTAMLKSGSKLVEVEYNAVADARVASKLCFLYGTATRAT